jgi:hypothetical protein
MMNIGKGQSRSADDLKKEAISQVINLLRTNTQNIFHLEKLDIPILDADVDDANNINYSDPLPAPTNKKVSTLKLPKGHHKHSRSATTAADYKIAQEKALEWHASTPASELLSIDWSSRPRSYSEAPTPTFLSNAAPPPTSPSVKRKGKKDKEKRGSKPLAPVMAFTSTPKRGTSLLDVDTGSGIGEDTNALIDNGCNETLIALNASKEKDKKHLKKKDRATSQIITPVYAVGNGYFDKFMSDFYPNLPSSRSSTPPATGVCTHIVHSPNPLLSISLSSSFYLLSSIFYLLSSIFYLLSSIFYLLSSIFYLLSSIFYRL